MPSIGLSNVDHRGDLALLLESDQLLTERTQSFGDDRPLNALQDVADRPLQLLLSQLLHLV